MADLLFTVFTPTYNRAHLLHRVYESLCQQTFRDFEWLIVDDGSTDNTRDVVAHWQSEADFPIRYVWQENGHKKAAFNYGVCLAQGSLFLPADSDDRFLPRALELFAHYWYSIPENERHHYAGVCGLCQGEDGKLVGKSFPGNWGVDSDSLEMRYRYRVNGEKWGFNRIDILREYPFPCHLPGCVPENVVWSPIAMRYKTRFINQIVRIYFQDSGNQVTRQGNPASNAAGMLYWKRNVLSDEIIWFRYAPVHFLLEAARWTRFNMLLVNKKGESGYFWPTSALGKILVFVMAPMGFIWWLFDRTRTP